MHQLNFLLLILINSIICSEISSLHTKWGQLNLTNESVSISNNNIISTVEKQINFLNSKFVSSYNFFIIADNSDCFNHFLLISEGPSIK